MTKKDIEYFVKRYAHITKALATKQAEYPFYIGNRKKRIFYSEQLKTLHETIEEICEHIQEAWKRNLVRDILKGNSDVRLIHFYPCSRTTYYAIKKEFIEMIYRCCIAKQMISYEELLQIGMV